MLFLLFNEANAFAVATYLTDIGNVFLVSSVFVRKIAVSSLLVKEVIYASNLWSRNAEPYKLEFRPLRVPDADCSGLSKTVKTDVCLVDRKQTHTTSHFITAQMCQSYKPETFKEILFSLFLHSFLWYLYFKCIKWKDIISRFMRYIMYRSL